MSYLLNNRNVIEEKIKIKDIPCILLRPVEKNKNIPTVIFYHGWSSSKEGQRFRGFILSSLGYQVIIPDGLYHGERNIIDYDSVDSLVKYYWKTVLNNIDESEYIIDEAIDKYKADPKNIFVTGHSMGGFTTAGIFVKDDRVNSSVVVNGSCNWERYNQISIEKFNINIEEKSNNEELEKVQELDPIHNLEKISDRPILMLHGAADTIVSIEPQRIFYSKAKSYYNDKTKIDIIEYPNLNHYMTTNMMEDMVTWFETHKK